MAANDTPPGGIHWATAAEIDGWRKGLTGDFLQCRDFGHLWRPVTARWSADDNAYSRTMRCGRCHTERDQLLTPYGHVISSAYSYTDGYAAPRGQGRLGTAARDSIRLESILRLIGNDDGPDRRA